MNGDPQQQSQTVTLSVADWQTIWAGLYELPGKYGIPVINRLQAELQRPPAAGAEEAPSAEITALRGGS